MLREPKKEELCSYLEKPCFGKYWKRFIGKNEHNNAEFSLQDLKKFAFA